MQAPEAFQGEEHRASQLVRDPCAMQACFLTFSKVQTMELFCRCCGVNTRFAVFGNLYEAKCPQSHLVAIASTVKFCGRLCFQKGLNLILGSAQQCELNRQAIPSTTGLGMQPKPARQQYSVTLDSAREVNNHVASTLFACGCPDSLASQDARLERTSRWGVSFTSSSYAGT
eukprot:763989-Amphidinium_carterae.2